MNDRNHTAWTRLVGAARRVPSGTAADEADIAAPVGFATRVVACSGLRPCAVPFMGGLFGTGFDRLAARALGLAGACAVLFAVWGSLPSTAEARSNDSGTTTDAYLDPVGDYLAAVQSS
jgi:hypothetical protein